MKSSTIRHMPTPGEVWRHYAAGMPVKEIATVVGTTAAVVYNVRSRTSY